MALRAPALTSLLAGGVLVAVLTGGLRAAAPAVPALLQALDLRGYPVGTRPPPFSGSVLGAGPMSLTQHRGKVVILNFWASWCHACRLEMPVLERLRREFAPRGLVVVGVNARESPDAIARHAKEFGLTFPLILDPDGAMNVLYGVVGIPTTFVVGRDGRAIAFAVGPRDWESATGRALIEALLAEPAAGPAAP